MISGVVVLRAGLASGRCRDPRAGRERSRHDDARASVLPSARYDLGRD